MVSWLLVEEGEGSGGDRLAACCGCLPWDRADRAWLFSLAGLMDPYPMGGPALARVDNCRFLIVLEPFGIA